MSAARKFYSWGYDAEGRVFLYNESGEILTAESAQELCRVSNFGLAVATLALALKVET